MCRHQKAVYRKLSEIGLSNRYKNDPGTNKFCKNLMTLVYLPPLHLVPMFDKLRHSMNEGDFLLAQLCDYFERTWLKNTIWQVDNISVFMQPIRTNNDIEGYHRRLNSKARKGKLQFYLLTKLLRKEADLVDVTASLVSQGLPKAVSLQRKNSLSAQARVIFEWERFLMNETTIDSLHNTSANNLVEND